MDSILRRRATKALTAVAVLAIAAVAYAFWTAAGNGTGSAATDSTAGPVTIAGDAVTGLAPGRTVGLTGTITNTNDYDTRVGTLSIDSIAVSPAVTGCDTATNYEVVNGSVAVNTTLQEAGAAGDSVAFPAGLTVRMKETGADQDACKGATITVSYSSN